MSTVTYPLGLHSQVHSFKIGHRSTCDFWDELSVTILLQAVRKLHQVQQSKGHLIQQKKKKQQRNIIGQISYNVKELKTSTYKERLAYFIELYVKILVTHIYWMMNAEYKLTNKFSHEQFQTFEGNEKSASIRRCVSHENSGWIGEVLASNLQKCLNGQSL